MTKPIPRQTAAIALYGGILNETKIRMGIIEDALNGKIPLPSPILSELCFLQLRMLCELIALGCLVVHGDIRETKSQRFQKEWSADKIIKALGELHPAFYPLPYRDVNYHPGQKIRDAELIKDGYLTKDDLIALYGKCGTRLHRGTAKRFMKTPTPIQFNREEILTPIMKIGRLLSSHVIALFEEGSLVMGILRNAEDNERVQVAFAGRLKH